MLVLGLPAYSGLGIGGYRQPGPSYGTSGSKHRRYHVRRVSRAGTMFLQVGSAGSADIMPDGNAEAAIEEAMQCFWRRVVDRAFRIWKALKPTELMRKVSITGFVQACANRARVGVQMLQAMGHFPVFTRQELMGAVSTSVIFNVSDTNVGWKALPLSTTTTMPVAANATRHKLPWKAGVWGVTHDVVERGHGALQIVTDAPVRLLKEAARSFGSAEVFVEDSRQTLGSVRDAIADVAHEVLMSSRIAAAMWVAIVLAVVCICRRSQGAVEEDADIASGQLIGESFKRSPFGFPEETSICCTSWLTCGNMAGDSPVSLLAFWTLVTVWVMIHSIVTFGVPVWLCVACVLAFWRHHVRETFQMRHEIGDTMFDCMLWLSTPFQAYGKHRANERELSSKDTVGVKAALKVDALINYAFGSKSKLHNGNSGNSEFIGYRRQNTMPRPAPWHRDGWSWLPGFQQ